MGVYSKEVTMIGNLFKKKQKGAVRELSSPGQLISGDMITLKQRTEIPAELQGSDLTVTKVNAYQYRSGTVAEFVVESSGGKQYSVAPDEDSGFSISKKISPTRFMDLFGGGSLSDIFATDNKEPIESALLEQEPGWINAKYFLNAEEAPAFFFDEDRRGMPDSTSEDDGSEELRYWELEGTNDSFSLTIEVYDGGETQCFVSKWLPDEMVENYWPKS